MFKGNEEAEAGNTNRLLFFWRIFPSCEYHYFWSQHYTCLWSAYLSWPPPVPVKHWTCPNHLWARDCEKGCTWTPDNQYFIELFTEVGLGGLPPLQSWEAAHQRSHGNRFHLSWAVTAWKSTPGLHSNSEPRCFSQLRLILTIRLYSSPSNSSQHLPSDKTLSLTPACIKYLMTQVYIYYCLSSPSIMPQNPQAGSFIFHEYMEKSNKFNFRGPVFSVWWVCKVML